MPNLMRVSHEQLKPGTYIIRRNSHVSKVEVVKVLKRVFHYKAGTTTYSHPLKNVRFFAVTNDSKEYLHIHKKLAIAWNKVHTIKRKIRQQAVASEGGLKEMAELCKELVDLSNQIETLNELSYMFKEVDYED